MACLLVAGLLLIFSGFSVNDLLLRLRGTLVIAESQTVFVPQDRADGTAAHKVILRSLSNEPIRLVGATSSCSCVSSGTRFPITLEPLQRQILEYSVHLPERANAGDLLAKIKFFVEADSSPLIVEFRVGEANGNGR
jgi:hypothetical protein